LALVETLLLLLVTGDGKHKCLGIIILTTFSQGIFRPSRRCEVSIVNYVTVVATQKAGK